MATRTFTAIIHKQDDLYVAECGEGGILRQAKVATDEFIENL